METMPDTVLQNPVSHDEGSAPAELPPPAKRPRRGSRKAAAATTAAAAFAASMPEAPSAASDDLVVLPSDLGIEQTQDLRAQLAACFERAGTVVFEASAVQRVHTAAMQLFVMFCRDRRAAGFDTEWRQPSTTLQTAAAVMGVANHLQISRNPS